MNFNRELSSVLRGAVQAGRSVLLFGPRQTGKTTLIKEVCAGSPCLEYPLQLPSVRSRLEGDPEVLRREVDAVKGPGPTLIFIDEIQKVPPLMDVLQYFWWRLPSLWR